MTPQFIPAATFEVDGIRYENLPCLDYKCTRDHDILRCGPVFASAHRVEPEQLDTCALCGKDPGGAFEFVAGEHYCLSCMDHWSVDQLVPEWAADEPKVRW